MKAIILILVALLISTSDLRSQDDNPVVISTAGIWSGRLPCADCESISYRLNLRTNLTYLDQMTYNGKNVGNVISDGTWKLLNDSTAETISSSGIKNIYRIRGIEMIMLDDKGEPMQGPSPDMFRLTKLSKGNINPDDLNSINQLLEERRKSGTDFIAAGNEPFWSVEIDLNEKISFNSLTDVGSVTVPAPVAVPVMDVAAVSYSATSESGTINVTVFKEICTDGMTGLESPYRVTVDVQSVRNNISKTFTGCGRYLSDGKLNSTWVLEKFMGNNLQSSDFPDGYPTIIFKLDEENVSGKAGCNSYSGKVESLGDRLRFGSDYIMTRMACPNLEFEQKYMEALKGRTLSYSFVEDKLILKDGESVVMEFTESKK